MNIARFAGTGGVLGLRARGVVGAAVLMAFAAAAHGQCQGQWSMTGAGGGTDGTVYALATLPDGDIVAGGAFSTAGGQSAAHVARYNPKTRSWSPLGAGVNGTVYCVRALSSGDVVVGGNFNSAGGRAAYDIAVYSAANGEWSALGQGTSSIVYALAELPGGDVVAGGFFNHASDVPGTHYIARFHWNSGAWVPLGNGLSSYVSSLAVTPEGNIIVGGGFTVAAGSAGDHIAQFDTVSGTWSALGLGLGNDANVLLPLPGGDLIAGGIFTTAGGSPASHIARYSAATNTWASIGANLNSSVHSLVLRGDEVIVGGAFTNQASRICRYDTTTGQWKTLGGGCGDVVLALTNLASGEVMAGGDFTMAGDEAANYAALWAVGPSVTRQPTNASSCPFGSAAFSVAATGEGGLNYSWEIEAAPGDWIKLAAEPSPLPDGGTAYADSDNAGSALIGVRNRTGMFNVRCIVSDDCAAKPSNPAALRICIADFNCTDIVSVQDIFDFLTAWFAGDGVADVNGINGVSLQDLFDFLTGWFAGCD